MGSQERTISGEIELFYEWKESASGHYEKECSAKLLGGASGATVVLELKSSEIVFIGKNSGRKSMEERYEMPISKLIALLKSDGIKIS